MRRLLLTAILMSACGCLSVATPFDHRPVQRVDDPTLPTSEQMRRGRDRLPLPDSNPVILPRTYAEFPDMHNR
jgi:hypothetical protein